MIMSVIVAAMSDGGSFKTIFPVVKILSERHQIFLVISDGRAAETMFNKVSEEERRGINRISLQDLLSLPLSPKVIITGMSCDNVEYRVAVMYKDRCPVVVIPDQWSTPLFAGGWNESEHIFPDVVCVNDEIGRQAVRAWGFNGLVLQTGWPALDQYADKEKLEEGRREIWETLQLVLRLELTEKLILFVGQGTRENTEALQELLEVIPEIGLSVKVAAREHPNMRRDSPDEAKFWDEVVKKNRGCFLDTSEFSSSQILSAAKLVISDFSTMLMEAVILGKPVISVLFPDKLIVKQFYQWEWAERTFPLAALGCCPVAFNRDELCLCLWEALTEEKLDYLYKAQEVFRLDGRNSQRVATVVDGLIESCTF